MLVVVTREAGRNDAVRDWLTSVAILEVPLTATAYRPLDDVEADLARPAAHGPFTVLVVTSARSRDYLQAARRVCARDVEVWTVGAATSSAVTDAGLPVTGEAPSALEVARRLDHGPVLALGAREMRGELATELAARAIRVETVACYETVPLEPDEAARAAIRNADAIVIGAPSAWRIARTLVSPATWVVVPGETTAAAVRADHDRVLVGWRAAIARRLEELVAGERSSPGAQ
ncbi:MAG: uroporphyrinogen-III synthase [Acidimicrobiales bacterium]